MFDGNGLLHPRVCAGVLVSSYDDGNSRFLLDDGTGVIELSIQLDMHKRDWQPGTYVMVVGPYCIRADELPLIKVKLVKCLVQNIVVDISFRLLELRVLEQVDRLIGKKSSLQT